MKKFQLVLILVMTAGLLAGCTNYEKAYNKNTIVVKGNGSIVEIAVENFKGSSVKEEDLTAYIDEQIEVYNEEHGKNMVKNKSINTEDMSKVKLVLTYKDMESYNGFNLLDCQLEDFSEMEDSEIKGTFTSAEGKSVKAGEMEGTKKAKVLVVTEATDVVVKGDILYYNKEVSLKDGVATTSGKENAIIVFK